MAIISRQIVFYINVILKIKYARKQLYAYVKF